MANNPKIEVEIGANTNQLKSKLKETDAQLEKTGKSFNKLNEFAVGALQGIAAAFTVSAIVNFGKAVLDTTAKFQKFEAVLTNTLGSSSEAQLALIQIQDFASKTPFAVDELTNSFVKLANQGFKPTVAELRSLGDLAASTGKSFDQLAEAIIDAQVGEFERLKEFGVRAKVEGDNVAFTFKGVETQVKNTSEAIRGYVLSLGDAEGVSGAMASISETLGGKISNLGDNLDTLKLAIGNQTSGIFAASLDWLNNFVEATTRAAKGVAKLREEIGIKQLAKDLEAQKKAVIELADGYKLLDPSLTSVQALAKAIAKLKQPLLDALEGGDAFFNQTLTVEELEQRVQGFEDLAKELFNVSKKTINAKDSVNELGKKLKEVTDEAINFSGVINSLNTEFTIKANFEKGLGESKDFFQSQSDTSSLSRLKEETDASLAEVDRLQAASDALFIKGVQTRDNFNALFQDFAFAGISNFAFAIGEAFADGENALEAGGAALLGTLGGFLVQFGELAVATGIASEGIKKALALNPILAIVGGAALIALGAFVSKKASNISRGAQGAGVSGGGTSGVSQGTNFTGQGQGSNAFNRDLNLRGEFRIDGTDLVYVVDQARASQI